MATKSKNRKPRRAAHSTNWQTGPEVKRRARQPRFSGTLPDGTTTTNAKQYIAAWRGLAEPIAQEFGWQTHGYEPGISFAVGPQGGPIPPHGQPSGTFHFPLAIALKLADLILRARTVPGMLKAPDTRNHPKGCKCMRCYYREDD